MQDHPVSLARPMSILVVDDDPLVREVTALMLSDAGHTVREAADGLDALAVLGRAGPVDLLITDINMPGMDGLELVREVRMRWPDMPVLLVSGRARPAQGEAFMAKPFGWRSLMGAVAQAAPPGAEHDPGEV